jgi:multidrug resistance efflux pump
MSDKIAEIRKRHSKRSEIDQSGCYRLDGLTYMGSLAQSQEDVDTLLAEDARHRAEIERLRENVDRAGKEVERADRLRAEIARVKSDERENRAEIERLRAAARNALNELNCIEEDGGHRCIRCDSEIDEGHHVRLALRNALEAKP